RHVGSRKCVGTARRVGCAGRSRPSGRRQENVRRQVPMSARATHIAMAATLGAALLLAVLVVSRGFDARPPGDERSPVLEEPGAHPVAAGRPSPVVRSAVESSMRPAADADEGALRFLVVDHMGRGRNGVEIVLGRTDGGFVSDLVTALAYTDAEGRAA